MAADHVQSATSSPNIHSAAVTFSLCTCSVYLLDYTSEVEVTSCVDCRIFIGKPLSPISGCPFCTAGAGQLKSLATVSACSSNCPVQCCWGHLQ